MRRFQIAACSLVLCAGCINLDPPIDPTRHFIMDGHTLSDEVGGPMVDVKAIDLEPYLTGPRMVVRVGTNELQFSDVHRWAEPLADNIRAVLAGNLTSPSTEPGLGLKVYVHRFEGRLPDEVVLAATWSLQDASGNVRAEKRSEHVLSGWDGTDYHLLAGLLESTLELLAQEVMAAL